MKSYKNKVDSARLIRLNLRAFGRNEMDPRLSQWSSMKLGQFRSLKVWTREQCLHQTAGVGGDIGPRPRRPKRPGSRRKEEGRSNRVDSGSSEDPADPRRRSSPMVITASLTIPMSGAFTLNLDDPDIPYIEETPKQPSAPPRRQRQRSISGCSEGIAILFPFNVPMHFQFLKYFLPNSFDLHRIVSHLFCSITCQHIFWNIFFQISSICSKDITLFLLYHLIYQCTFNFWNTFFQIPSIWSKLYSTLFTLPFVKYFLKYIFPNSFDLQQSITPFCFTI